MTPRKYGIDNAIDRMACQDRLQEGESDVLDEVVPVVERAVVLADKRAEPGRACEPQSVSMLAADTNGLTLSPA